MNYILFDGPNRTALMPFTYTRPVADIEWGIGSIRDSWERALGYTTSTITESHLNEVWPTVFFESNIFINSFSSYTIFPHFSFQIVTVVPDNSRCS